MEERKRSIEYQCTLATLILIFLAFAAPPGVVGQTPIEPGWTVSTFVGGLSAPANGLEFKCSTGDFYVGDFSANQVRSVPPGGGSSAFFASVPGVDEMALNRSSTFLFAKEHAFGGPIHMFDGAGAPLGTISTSGFPTGVAFDSTGNFYAVDDESSGTVLKYPASTLPPNTPVASLFASGLPIGLEGMRFDSLDHLFVTGFTAGTVVQVVPPSGPHITWASGLNNPINVAFDPCTQNLFVSNLGSGTIVRVTSPGVFTLFATGLSQPYALVFDAVGNLYVNEFDTGRIVKFSTPNACAHPCPGGAQLTALSPAKVWIGLKNSDDQGTQFDLKVEMFQNADPVPVASGLTRCVTGVTRNPTFAKLVDVPFDPFAPVPLAPGDTLSLKVSTRIGTNPNDTKCAGPGGSHNNARGLRLYYDSPSRDSHIDATIAPNPNEDLYLRSDGGACPNGDGDSPNVFNRFLSPTAPTGATKCKDSLGINFNGGNPYSVVGTWSLTLP